LDLKPRNLLVLQKSPYSLIFINLLLRNSDEFSTDFTDFNFIEINYDVRPVNVQHMGILFFYICFEIWLDDFDNSSYVNIVNSFSENIEDYEVDPIIFNLIRVMLNVNPIDRPTLSSIYEILSSMVKLNRFFIDKTKYQLASSFFKMKNEIEMEQFENRSKMEDKQEWNNKNIFEEVITQIDKKIPRKKQTKISAFISKLTRREIKRILDYIRQLNMNQVWNSKDKFEMINDMEWFDFNEPINYKFNINDFNRINNERLYSSELLDLKFLAYEMIAFNKDVKQQDQYYVTFYQNNRFTFIDTIYDNISIVSIKEKFNVLDVFFVFVKYEVLNLFKENIKNLNVNFNTEDSNEVEKKEEEETINNWKQLTKIPWEYALIMVLIQVLMIVFLVMFIFRQTDLVKFDKKDFTSFISF
jgi:hypothetical protein